MAETRNRMGPPHSILGLLRPCGARQAIRTLFIPLMFALSSPANGDGDPGFDQVQIRGTHNSYGLNRSPQQILDDYDVWTVELDFGRKGSEWLVGHDDVQEAFGLRSLSDWLRNVAAANARNWHPIFIKLEAKNPSDHCDWPTCTEPCCSWGWAEHNHWPEHWGVRDIAPILQSIFETEGDGLFTPRELAEWRVQNPGGNWPPMRYVQENGPFVVYLFDAQCPTDVDPAEGVYFSGSGFGGLRLENDDQSCIKFNQIQRRHAVILGLDADYENHDSFSLMYPPVPTCVSPAGASTGVGTSIDPFAMVGDAINAAQTSDGVRLRTTVLIGSGEYRESLRLDGPITLRASDGPVRIGGPIVAYAITFRVLLLPGANTTDPVDVTLEGDQGTGAEWRIERGRMPFVGCTDIFRFAGKDLGRLRSITIRVLGGDDLALEDVIVDSATRGRFLGRPSGRIDGSPVTVPLQSP